MTTTLIVSNVLLWIAVMVLLVAVMALARQIGILYERVAPMGALMMDSGPKVGDPALQIELPSLTGGSVKLGAHGPRSTLVFFLSPTCPVCKKLLPILDSVRRAESSWLNVVLASDGDTTEHVGFIERAGLQSFPYVVSAQLGMHYRVSKLPYALLTDEHGQIAAKGLVNSREQLESLFAARDLGVASVQAYLDEPHLHKEHA